MTTSANPFTILTDLNLTPVTAETEFEPSRTSSTESDENSIVSEEEFVEDLPENEKVDLDFLDGSSGPSTGNLFSDNDENKPQREPIPSSFLLSSNFSLSQFLKRLTINTVIPFVNGMMLGFGEILAHEIAFKFGWSGARIHPLRVNRYLEGYEKVSFGPNGNSTVVVHEEENKSNSKLSLRRFI
ncbi:hypothetical protein NADFUDRAFT_42322 [Nadsonia fulvescens var. elongata DSM 6958]|uniref:TOM13-domain-containing protein n=1 Tax=Nadsonia fulvescens var. elongata DSM 6958 TaxID=857566 RepID=A0A1E3PHY6_9ASCO|nr:hypothetical protein NADFUDRAFT_42322 [Nadsonia fulvescens var. elongata DSM 6958]